MPTLGAIGPPATEQTAMDKARVAVLVPKQSTMKLLKDTAKVTSVLATILGTTLGNIIPKKVDKGR